jgi:hypothetical protein
MLGAARTFVTRVAASRARGLKSAAAPTTLLPPLKVAVTGAAGQIGYALVMRIARYVDAGRLRGIRRYDDSFYNDESARRV